MKMNEEQRQIAMMVDESSVRNIDTISAFVNIPYSLISSEVGSGDNATYLEELTQIRKNYITYKRGASFSTEGTNGKYIAADLRYKMASSLINKEARFLFSETPDMVVMPKGIEGQLTDEYKKSLQDWNTYIHEVLKKNMFEDLLLKAAKDCFIGKRVAAMANFNEEDGVTITFFPSLQFLYETRDNNPNILRKFVAFMVIGNSQSNKAKRIFKKKYELSDDNRLYLTEVIYDGAGSEIEVLSDNRLVEGLEEIPAVVFINDGLSGEEKGESEIELLQDFERWYSRLSSADIDAERKSMNPTKYTIDMEGKSTENLSTGAGAFWDLQSDQNLDNAHPSVGILEPNMNYSDSLKQTLDRIKTVGYEQIDMPNITLETMQGAITSGKALKAIYWPLIVRCKEKMKMWGPKLQDLLEILIDGALAFPTIAQKYIGEPLNDIEYDIEIRQNLPLPEDEAEEKQLDIAEVEAKVMSRKAYMKKWRNLSDSEVDEELKQIALERQLIEDSEVFPNIPQDV